MPSARPPLDLDALVPDEVFECFQVATLLPDMREQLARHAEVVALEQVGGERHFRFDCADGQLVGAGEVCGVTDGFLVQVTDVEVRTPRVISFSGPDLIRIRIAIEGCEVFAPAGQPVVTTEGPVALVVIEPPGQPPAQVVVRGREAAVTLCADRKAVEQLWRGREHELPALLQAFLAGTLTETIARRLPLKADLLRCVEDLLRCEHEGLARTLVMRSKAMEIFCQVLRMLEVDEGFGGPEVSLMTSRGVMRAQQILKERFASPPSLDDLAREVGLSRSGLCAGFRQLVGRAIFGYVQELRMERSRELLSDGAVPITEVAYAVGYSHQSSFTVAFHRRYGMNPSELRRRAFPAAPVAKG